MFSHILSLKISYKNFHKNELNKDGYHDDPCQFGSVHTLPEVRLELVTIAVTFLTTQTTLTIPANI